ncbi:MAG: glycosyltransferase family 2 protein [Kiloniellales bacterium]
MSQAPAGATLTALVVAHNEEAQLADCLERLGFADELVVVLDRCSDGSKEIAARYSGRLIEGAWAVEGDRREAGIAACTGPWILEVDADERVSETLAREIREVVAASPWDRHLIPVDNYIGGRLVRHGWGAAFGKAAYPGLFRKGTKAWGRQRVHPKLTFTGHEGPPLENRLIHHVDRNISDLMKRLDSYSTARARDLRESGEVRRQSLAGNLRRLVSRFLKCYLLRRGYREGGLGLMIALCAGLYPLLSYLKASLEDE